MAGGIVGGAMLPHAPQFFTLPDTEDKDTVANVKRVAREIGDGLRALKPDVWIVVSNDHVQQFFERCCPPFTVHVGGRATGSFAGHDFDFNIASDFGFQLIRELYVNGFDPAFSSTAEVDYALGIPLTHLGVTSELVLPIFLNAYLPPQPPMERCFAFGRALARAVERSGKRAVIIASGGMSHFPGTDHYSNPCLDWDLAAFERISRGNLRSLLSYDEKELDETGNIELRSWAIAAGALGERAPDVAQMDPSWHHNYASLGFTTDAVRAEAVAAHYPQIAPALVKLTAVLHALAHDEHARSGFLNDRSGFCLATGLEGEQFDALVDWDVKRIVSLGVHPLVPFLANLHIARVLKRN